MSGFDEVAAYNLHTGINSSAREARERASEFTIYQMALHLLLDHGLSNKQVATRMGFKSSRAFNTWKHNFEHEANEED